MKKSAPAIPLFGDAYLADTRHLSLEEHGAYLQLLMIAWRTDGCRLPDDDARLARMLGVTPAKWRKLKAVVMAFWDLEDGHWTQARLSKERAFVDQRRREQSEKAQAKWGSISHNEDDDPARKRAARMAEARKKGRHTSEQWEALLEATGHKCVKCLATGVEIVKDHILPIYRGGSDAISNIQPLCNRCNSSKSSDNTDYRLSVCFDLFERLPECLPEGEFAPAPPPPPPQDKKKEKEASPPLPDAPCFVDDAFDCWNEHAPQAGWPSIQAKSEKRRKLVKARLRDNGLDGFKAALIRARSSPYLGRDPPNFFTFDWLIVEGNFLKVIEGNYDRRIQQRVGGHQPDPDGLGPSARAGINVFGAPPPRSGNDGPVPH